MSIARKTAGLIARKLSLAARRERLEREINEERARPTPDHLRLTHLKRLRLRAKDELVAIVRRVEGARRRPA